MKPKFEVQTEAAAVSADMRELYADFRAGKTLREKADTLANIAGKNLKALAIIIADQMRQDGHLSLVARMKTIGSPEPE